MTDMISVAPYSLLGKSTLYQMAGNAEHDWRHGYYEPMPTLASQWVDGRRPQMGGMQDVDLRMFQNDNVDYVGQYGSNSDPLISPDVGYQADGHWPADIDMVTSPTIGFPIEVTEVYHTAHPSSNAHLQPPGRDDHVPASITSPKKVHARPGSQRPQRYVHETTHADQRPTFSRSITAPEPLELKRSGTSEDGDDDYAPAAKEVKNRSRKRQRIPHTAVERRYRENLNSHLDKLRQTVPSLAARGTKPGDANHDGAKPSKCEILNGAIEHIGALDKENESLKIEAKLLKSHVEELERRYRGNPRASAFSA